MANQSIKQEIYNSLIQKAFAEKRNEELAALNNDFAAFQEQQKNPEALMADFNSFMQSQQPKSQPVQTQKIPSLSDHQKLVNKAVEKRTRLAALDKKNVEKQKPKEENRAIVSGISQKKENTVERTPEGNIKDSYARQQQEENMLASQSAKKKTSEILKDISVDNNRFNAGANISGKNNSNDYRKAILSGIDINNQPEVTANNEIEDLAEVFKDSMKDYAPKITYRGKKWNNPYDSLSEEQKQAVKDYIIENQNRTDLSKEERENLNAFNKAYLNSSDPKDANYNALSASLNSKSNLGRALQAGAAGFVDFNMPFAEAVTKGVSKLPALNENEINKNIEDIRNYIEQSKALNPTASEMGRSAGQIYDYAVTTPLVGGVAEAAGLGKAGTIALNQAVQAGQDIGLDIIPEAKRMLREEGKINWGELVKRFGVDVLQNSFMEAIPYLGAIPYDSLVKTVGNNADIFKNIDATGALKNVPDTIRSLADATNNIKAANEGTRQILSGMETESDVVNGINNDFSRLMSMNQPERTAMKNIFSPEDLDAAQNAQLKSLLEANQPPKQNIPSLEELRELEREASVMDEAEDLSNIWKSDGNTNGLRPHATNQGVSPSIENAAEELSKQMDAPKYSVDAGVDNPNLTREANDAINSYLFQLEDPFNNPKVDDAVGGLISKVTSDNGFKLMDDYNELSRQLRESVEDNPAIREQLAELRKGINSVDKGERDAVKDLLDYADIQNAIADYKKALNGTDEETIDKAAKSLDAARNRVARRNNADATLKEAFGGSYGPIINRPKNAFELKPDEAVIDDIVADMVKQDLENPNRFVEDVSKRNEVAENAGMGPGTYKLQTFADGEAPKERWNTSAFRDNTVEKQGWGDKLDRKDYGYRVYSEAEQNADAAAENLSAIELIEKDQFTPSDVKQAMKREAELYEMGDEESIKKAQRLGTKIAFETREAGRIPQALAEFDRTTPQGQLRFAQNAIDDIVDKKVGTGTSEALDNIVEKINKAYDKHGTNKEAFAKEVEDIFNKDITNYVNGKTAKKMQPRAIKGKNKILKMIANGAKIEDISDVIYKQNGGVKLTAQENKQIYDLLQSAQKLPGGSYEQEELLARAAKIAVAKAPSTLGQKIRSVLYTNMLGNFKTALSRNAFGNLAYQTLEQGRSPIAALVDRATSLATKKRSTLGWNGAKFKAYGQGLKKGAAEQISDMTKGISTGRSGAKGWEVALANNATTFNDTKAAGKLANDVEYYVRSSMALGDRPWYEANYAQRSTELHQLIDKYGKENVVGLSGIKDEDLDDVIDMIASVHAADSVFQKHGKMSKGLTDIRNGLGQMSEGVLGVDVLSTAASPFTMTPGNMLERAIEYTPLGFVKNAFETGKEIIGKKGFNQRRFVDEASRTITGLPVLYGAYKLAQKGGINGGYSTDQDEKQAQIDDGYIEYGLNLPESIPLLGGKTLDTSDLPVYGPFMQAGSVIAEQGLTPQASLQAAEAVLGGSTTQGLRRAFGGDSSSYSSQDSIVENLKNTVLSSGSQLIPSLARQTAQTIDPYKRDLGEYGTLGYYWNLMRNSDPVGRQQLPIKYDVEGNPVLQNQGRSLGSKILENYFLPMNMSEYEQSPLNQEASRLLESADTAMAFVPKAARKDLRGWDEKAQKEYTEEQFRQYKQDLGTLNSKAGHALIESDFYQGLSDAQKAKTLSEVYSAMKQIAKENATGLPSDDKIAAAYKEGDIDGMLNYIAGKTAVKETGYKSNSKVGQAIQAAADSGDTEAAMDMSSQVELLPNYGLDKPGPAGAYTKAYDVYDGLSAEEFAKTYKAIDTDHNQGLTKAEIIDYMNKKGYNQKDGMDFWQAYARTEGKNAWKIPKLEGNTWK